MLRERLASIHSHTKKTRNTSCKNGQPNNTTYRLKIIPQLDHMSQLEERSLSLPEISQSCPPLADIEKRRCKYPETVVRIPVKSTLHLYFLARFLLDTKQFSH